MALRELKSLRALPQDANIVQIKELIREDDSQLHFVFEYMPDGNLYQLIKEAMIRKGNEKSSLHTSVQSDVSSRVHLNPGTIQSVVRQVLKGLEHIHALGFIHRGKHELNYNLSCVYITYSEHIFLTIFGVDIKPENILLNGKVCKIADFGLARNPKMKPDSPSLTAYISTRWYRAPEVLLRHTNYSTKIDIFAVGLVMAEMIALKPLCPGSSEIDQLHKVFSLLGQPNHTIWPEGVELLDRMKLPMNINSPISIVENSNSSFACRRRLCNDNHDPSMNNLKKALPSANSVTLSFIHNLLKMNPDYRPTAHEAAFHPYLCRSGMATSAKNGKNDFGNSFVAHAKTHAAHNNNNNNICMNSSIPYLEAEAIRRDRRNKSRVVQCPSITNVTTRRIPKSREENTHYHMAPNLPSSSKRTQLNGFEQQLQIRHQHNFSTNNYISQNVGRYCDQSKKNVSTNTLMNNISQQEQEEQKNPFAMYDDLFLGNHSIGSNHKSMHSNQDWCLRI